MNKSIYNKADGVLLMNSNTRILSLKLTSEKRVRKIGWLSMKGGVLSYFKEAKESNTFRKNNSWGICWAVLDYLPDDNSTINIRSEKAIYRITKREAIESGSFLYFKIIGIEKQFFIPKEQFKTEQL